MKSVLLFSAFYILLAACAPQIGPSLTSGVKGQVLIGPMCPVMQEGVPCPDQPYQAKLIALDLNGRVVARASSDAEGKFEIELPPGEYILRAENPEGETLPYAGDVEFTVTADEFTEIVVYFDSGIR